MFFWETSTEEIFAASVPVGKFAKVSTAGAHEVQREAVSIVTSV